MTLFSYSGRNLLYMVLLFLAYLLSAQVFSYFYATIPSAPILVWPSSGIALAGLILGGIGLWPAVFMGALVHNILYGSTTAAILGLAVANALQAVVGAYFLKRFGFTNSFSRVPHTIAFILTAVFVTLIVPSLGMLALLIGDVPLVRSPLGIYIPWWIAQMLSVLIVTPFLVRWLPRFRFTRTKREMLEAWLSIASVVGVGFLLYWTPYHEIADVPLVYLILVPLLWIALRIGPRFMTLALFLNAALALGGTAYLTVSSGSIEILGQTLLQTEIFIIVISFIFLLLVTVAEERKDISNDLRENVRRLEDAIERVRKEDEAKSRFIATLAHELRNPLAPLMSSLEILKLAPPSAQQTSELANGMTDHMRTMRRLLDDLLDISRISREKLLLQKERVDLNAIITQSARAVDRLMNERSHTLVLDLPDTAIMFEADPVRLEQVFVNLLNNAAKYTEPGGTITVGAKVAQEFVTVSVVDTGIGMDENLLEHVFEAFFQIEQPGKMHAGLGIGLSLTKNLVEMHGGTIEAKSAGVDQGSEFMVRLPLSDSLPEATTNHTRVDMQSNGGLRILIVDDNRAAADALAKLLALRGNVTEAVYASEDAIERAPTFCPEVVLLDIGLPNMDGYEVAKHLR
ncbi:MAG: ATP-binding protein, partial [Rectinemataceae bacterium]|nr:ATP-binding protein [Rectinemataceae bacterium]